MDKSYNKGYRAKDVYLCHIAYQSTVDETEVGYWGDINYEWKYYPSTIKVALCVKTLKGFKHILSGNIYKVASYKTGNQYVIQRKAITPWLKADDRVAKAIMKKKGSLNIRIPMEIIEKFENKYNNELQKDLEEMLSQD